MLDVNEKKYLSVLAEKYVSADAAAAEVISLASRLTLPKGTEHFLSDLHGEYDAYSHIRRSASGVIRRKIDLLFNNELSDNERARLATLIYYPEKKLEGLRKEETEAIIKKLFSVLGLISEKYTRERLRSTLSETGELGRIIYELMYSSSSDLEYTVKTVLRIKKERDFIFSLSMAIRRLAVDRLHIVGDIFDRGPRPDKILEELSNETNVDIQWGNHDILWMGAASGSALCIMGALFNSLSYRNLDFLEVGYGISLRPLAEFAEKTYRGEALIPFLPKGDDGGRLILSGSDELTAAMRCAVAIMMWKLEGQAILRNPEFGMNERLLLDKIRDNKIGLNGVEYQIPSRCFVTVDKSSPYKLTEREEATKRYLVNAFLSSEKLARHISFLYKSGSIYKVYNRNLIFHGCIPMDNSGEFLPLEAAGGRQGRELMDYCDSMARLAFFAPLGTKEKAKALDFMWFLWCGRNSPLSGREKITTFERIFISDSKTHKEPKNPYYKIWESPSLAEKVLAEFGLFGERSHIINGHIPVKRGENPIKAGGRLILIDGGFCHAFLGRTGIAGYTLIYNSDGMRISAHNPFPGIEAAVEKNADIAYDTAVFETAKEKIKVISTDEGAKIVDKIADLMLLKEAYEKGEIAEGTNSRLGIP